MVLVEDECRIAKETDTMAIWFPRGTIPLIHVDTTKEGVSFYGALNVATGKCTILRSPGPQVSQQTVRYLEHLEQVYAGKRVLLIWDGAPWHRGAVKAYLRRHKQFQLELLSFPPYSPDLNPQEHIWKQAKQQTCHNSEQSFPDRLKAFIHYIRTHTFPSSFLSSYA